MALAFLVLLTIVALQVLLLKHSRPRRLVGDETEYLARDARATSKLWVRVPMHGAMLRLAQWLGRGTFAGYARLTVAVQSALATALVVGVAGEQWGVLPACLAALMLIPSAERAILANHLWPDIVMGLFWAVAIYLVLVPGPTNALALAACGGIAMGIRIEGAIFGGLAVLVAGLQGDLAMSVTALVVNLAFVSLYVGWNRYLTGRWALDTTVGFNLTVFRVDADDPQNTIGQSQRASVRHHQEGRKAPQTRWINLPGRFAARLRLLLGPESFVTQKLLGCNAPDYTHPWPADGSLWRINLRHWFTLCFVVLLLLAPYTDLQAQAVLALGATVYAALSVRSRYRMALLPAMALLSAQGLASIIAAPRMGASLVSLAALVACWALLRFAAELRENENAPQGHQLSGNTPSPDICA